MGCKPTYKGVRYNSLEELYNANGVNEQQKQKAQQLYSQYLDTIFKTSKVKDIVYHGTDNKEQILKEGFKNNIELFESDDDRAYESGELGYGYYFTTTQQSAKNYGEPLAVILNNPDITNETTFNLITNEKGIQHFVKTKEQIHILGSKQDIEGFKKFVGDNQSTSLTNDEIGVVKDTIIKRLLKDKENSEKSITFAEINKSLGGRLSDALKGSSKTPEELWSNLSSEGKVQLIDCL